MKPPNFAADAPCTLRDVIDNDGWCPQNEPTAEKKVPRPRAVPKSGDPEKGN